ncbi:MAG: hypothetical protein O7E52_27910 [Candidatus Poribacteria bacterium]|nr:hypothetical protein [Candidatus Poribacteria bacterium]
MKRRPLKWSVSSDFAIFALNLIPMGYGNAYPTPERRVVLRTYPMLRQAQHRLYISEKLVFITKKKE